ncbi:hypothetical protein FFLO_07099 [Filobasidium floriforme]|uniref:Uncharacterized protein n=1 Tax=Filobasidium floriforme TaxID=5210 RepID=A0A8K0NJZ7_9TREE|nr:hypothetical protein FFLO_07099 [Filobasidium floriforme]
MPLADAEAWLASRQQLTAYIYTLARMSLSGLEDFRWSCQQSHGGDCCEVTIRSTKVGYLMYLGNSNACQSSTVTLMGSILAAFKRMTYAAANPHKDEGNSQVSIKEVLYMRLVNKLRDNFAPATETLFEAAFDQRYQSREQRIITVEHKDGHGKAYGQDRDGRDGVCMPA